MVNSGRSRTRLSVDARRSQLVKVGVELIATRSWDELTMAQIAEAAQVSKPLLYHYFSTKHDLYIAAVRAAADELSESTRPPPDLAPRAQLRLALEAHVDWVEAHALDYRTLLQGAVSGNPEVRSIIETSRAETVRRIGQSMHPEQPTPALRVALRGWVGFLEAACLEWLTDPELTKPELVRLLAASLPLTIAAVKRIE